MNEKTDSEAAEGATSTSGLSRNPIGQTKNSVSAPKVDTPPAGDKGNGSNKPVMSPKSGGNPLQQHSSPGMTPRIQTGMVAVTHLRPYAKNGEIYQDREDPLFAENIRKNGVLTDLVVTEDGEVLGGNRRLRQAKRAGLLEVPVKVVVCKTEDEKLLRVLDDNLQRVKTKEEIAREYVERLKVETRAAALRKAEASKKAKGQVQEVEKFTPTGGKKGKARDKAAKELNLSGVTAEKGRKVLEAVAKARAKEMPETADELLVMLNEKGFHSAFKRAEALSLIVPNKRSNKKAEKPPTSPALKSAGDDALKPQVALTSMPAVSAGPQDQIPTNDDSPPVVRIIASCDKVSGELDALEIADLSADQKRNLHNTLERIANWLANHGEMLQGFVQT